MHIFTSNQKWSCGYTWMSRSKNKLVCEKYKLCLKWHAWVWRSLIPESPVRTAIMYIWVHPSCCALWSILRNSVMPDDGRLWEETMLSKMPVVMKSSFISFHFKIRFVWKKLNCNYFWKWKLSVLCLYFLKINSKNKKLNHQLESVKREHLDEWVELMAWRN